MVSNLAKRLYNSFSNYQYHKRHKISATKILKSIEIKKGKTNSKLIKVSDEYAKDVLGSKIYSPWLYVYSAVNNQFKEGWIPDNYYGQKIVKEMKGKYGEISDFNVLTTKLFNSDNFPDSLYFANGLWYSKNYNILSETEASKILHEHEKIVFKMDLSLQGRGVHIIHRKDFNIKKLQSLGNGVVQKYITQHPFFQNIISTSVATIRITTFIDQDGEVSIRACYLRLGRATDSHVKSASHTRVAIDLKTGELSKNGYNVGWQEEFYHPDSKFIFEGQKIPNFAKCISTVIQHHKLIPFARIVGWDIIVDAEDNINIMEWNGSHNDIKFSEATQGPCFPELVQKSQT